MYPQQGMQQGCICDEMEMVVTDTHGRDQYSALGKAKLMGPTGINYATSQMGTWNANTSYPQYPPELISSNKMFIWNNKGSKRLTWKSGVGPVTLSKVQFSPREDNCWKDLPKKVTFSMKLRGTVVSQFFVTYQMPKNKHTPLQWVMFPVQQQQVHVQQQQQQQHVQQQPQPMYMIPQMQQQQQQQVPMMNMGGTNWQFENQKLQQENIRLKAELENLKKLVLNYATLLKQACQ